MTNFNPYSGLRHFNDSPCRKVLTVSQECQLYLKDLHSLILLDCFKDNFDISQFNVVVKHITCLISASAESLADSSQDKLAFDIDNAISSCFPSLSNTFVSRVDFNMQHAQRGCLPLFFPFFIFRFRRPRLLRAYLDALWVLRHMVCTSYTRVQAQYLLSCLTSKIGYKDNHIDQTLKTSHDYSLVKSEFSISATTAVFPNLFAKPESQSLQATSQFQTFTGSGLYSFGHSLFAYEALNLLSTDQLINQFHDIRIGPSFVANSTVALMLYLRAQDLGDQCKCIISDKHLILDTSCQLNNLPSLSDAQVLHQIKYSWWNTNDRYKHYKSQFPQLSTDQWHWIASHLQTDIYHTSGPYVCLYLRDGGFKSENNTFNSESDRNVDPSSFIPIIEELIEQGYTVVRLGDPKQAPIHFHSSYYFEYSHSPFKSDFNDLFLAAKCDFVVVGGAGGGANIGDLFCRPSLFVDFPIARRGLFSPLGVSIPKSYYLNNEPLSLDQLLSLTPHSVQDSIALSNAGITSTAADRDHCISVLKRFIHCCQSTDFIAEAQGSWSTFMLDSQGQYFESLIA